MPEERVWINSWTLGKDRPGLNHNSTGCVVLSKLLNLFAPQFPYLLNGDNKSILLL